MKKVLEILAIVGGCGLVGGLITMDIATMAFNGVLVVLYGIVAIATIVIAIISGCVDGSSRGGAGCNLGS